jgi:hypothetical protein
VTGLRTDLTPAERAHAEVRRLADRQRLLPDVMREAAQRGDFEGVARLRLEREQLPVRIWAAEYTAVHCELAAYDVRVRGGTDRHALLERATELARQAGLR